MLKAYLNELGNFASFGSLGAFPVQQPRAGLHAEPELRLECGFRVDGSHVLTCVAEMERRRNLLRLELLPPSAGPAKRSKP